MHYTTRDALGALADETVAPLATGRLVDRAAAVLATPAVAVVTTVAAGVGTAAGAAMGVAALVKGDEEEPSAPPELSGVTPGAHAGTLLAARRTQ